LQLVYYIWTENITQGYGDLFYKTRNVDGSWTEGKNISNTSSGDSRATGIVIDISGKVHIVWTEMTEVWAVIPGGEVYYDTYPK
jgi:hypothetical protein